MPDDELFAVYLMDERGNYDSPEHLTWEPATVKALGHRNRYHEIRVADGQDRLVLHILDGEIKFPTKSDIEDYERRN